MYKAGGFLMPTSSGAFSVSGLGFEPQGIFFFGGNQSAEDVVTTPANAGAFWGSAWLDLTSGAIDQQSLFSGAPQQFRFKPKAITASTTTAATADYEAEVSSFDPDGFTLNVSVAASGSRPIHWLAYGEFDDAEGTTATDEAVVVEGLTYRPTTGVVWHSFPSGAVRDRVSDGGNYLSLGSSNWPAELYGGGITNASAIASRVFSSLGAIGYTAQWIQHFTDGSTWGLVPWVAGSYLTGVDHYRPQPSWDVLDGSGGDGIHFGGSGSYPNRHSVQWWTGEGWVTIAQPPALGATAVYTAPANVPVVEAVLFYGTTGYGAEQLLTPNCAFVFGVLTEDYQGCVSYDLGIGGAPADGTPRFYQSRTKCLVSSMNTGAAVASGEIFGNEIHLTGVQEDSAPGGSMRMQVWGDEEGQTVMQRRRYVSRLA